MRIILLLDLAFKSFPHTQTLQQHYTEQQHYVGTHLRGVCLVCIVGGADWGDYDGWREHTAPPTWEVPSSKVGNKEGLFVAI